MDDGDLNQDCYCMVLRVLPYGDIIPCHHCYERIRDAKWRRFEESLNKEDKGTE